MNMKKKENVYYPMMVNGKFVPVLGTGYDYPYEVYDNYIGHEFEFVPHDDSLEKAKLTMNEFYHILTTDITKTERKCFVMNAKMFSGRYPGESVGARKMEKMIKRYLAHKGKEE